MDIKIELKNSEELKAFLKDIDELRKIARAIDRYNELQANYGLTERQEKRYDKLRKRVKEICDKWGLVYDIGGDPRGAPLIIALNDVDLKSWRYRGYVL